MRPRSPDSPPRRYEGMPTCASNGCRLPVASKPIDPRRSHGYHGSSYPQEIFSKWCSKHTCAYFFRNGEKCQNKKAQHDTVCALHTKCSVQSCTNGKIQVMDPDAEGDAPRYIRYDLCGEHKCTAPGCPAERSPVDGRNGYLPYCKKHRCQYQNCDSISGDKVSFCSKHKCKVPDCRTLAEDGFGLCVIHIVCEIPGCNTVKAEDKLKKGDYHRFCALHVKCEAGQCEALRIQGSKFCARHACPERGCNKSTGGMRYCEDHRCKHQTCDNPRGWVKKTARGLYCPMHTCRDDDCTHDVDTYHLYCNEHECSHPKCLTNAVWEYLCGDHLRLKYESAAKAKAKPEIEDLMSQLRERDQILLQLRLRQLDPTPTSSTSQVSTPVATPVTHPLPPLSPGGNAKSAQTLGSGTVQMMSPGPGYANHANTKMEGVGMVPMEQMLRMSPPPRPASISMPTVPMAGSEGGYRSGVTGKG